MYQLHCSRTVVLIRLAKIQKNDRNEFIETLPKTKISGKTLAHFPLTKTSAWLKHRTHKIHKTHRDT